MKPFSAKNSYIDTIKKLQMKINYKLKIFESIYEYN